MLIEPDDDGFDAHRAGILVAHQEEAEDQSHRLGFDGIDGELLLDPVSAPFDLDGRVAEWRTVAIPIALARVLLHGAQHVLGIFL
ncbi:hypothetical protein [Hyphomicrobium sp. CS1BSMeth3]|uniref:hypothetical protein n=1 Tax=Hyphomicrobium sp. CS1BSMeth3 TaxID=1892844 RepID=UPI0032AEDF2F